MFDTRLELSMTPYHQLVETLDLANGLHVLLRTYGSLLIRPKNSKHRCVRGKKKNILCCCRRLA